MTSKFFRLTGAALLLSASVAGCGDLATEPNAALQSQLLLRTTSLISSVQPALFDLDVASTAAREKSEGERNGPVSAATIASVEVRIARIALLTSGDAAEPADSVEADDGRWADLELEFNPDSTWFNLRSLASDSTLGSVPESVTGEVRAIRIYFGAARVNFKDGTTEALFIPRSRVTIPTRGVVVNEGRDVALVFEALSSFGRIVRTGNGLIMTPVFQAENAGQSKGRGAAKGKDKTNRGRSGR